jgi:hypothetical protein
MLHSSIFQKDRFKLLPGYRKSENRMLRKIFGPKREKLTAAGRKSLSEDLNNLYSSSKYN